MLNNISWIDYLIAISIALVIYYLVIGARYYADEIKDLLSGKRAVKFKPALFAVKEPEHIRNTQSDQHEIAGAENSTEGELVELEHLVRRLKMVIEDASRRELIPQEFKQYLMMILKEYPSVKNSPLRSSVNELIISESQKYGAVVLKAEEADMLWGEKT